MLNQPQLRSPIELKKVPKKKNERVLTLMDLPTVLRQNILTYLDFEEKVASSTVSKDWHDDIRNSDNMMQLSLKLSPSSMPPFSWWLEAIRDRLFVNLRTFRIYQDFDQATPEAEVRIVFQKSAAMITSISSQLS